MRSGKTSTMMWKSKGAELQGKHHTLEEDKLYTNIPHGHELRACRILQNYLQQMTY